MKLLASIAILIGLSFLVWEKTTSLNMDTPPVESTEALKETSMTKAAKQLIASLDPEQLKEATLSFDDEERSFWHFTPSPHRGLTWEKMNDAQQQALLNLLETGLSKQGLDKTREIMALELVLRDIEGRGADDRYRHPELYYLMLFGNPGEPTWGWRFEGHHVSLNYTSVADAISVTPAFMGANPAEVPEGAHKGKRVLSAEEDAGRELLASFDTEQLKTVIIASEAPEEIITGMDRKAVVEKQEGLNFQKMTSNQQKLLRALIDVYLDNMEKGIAKEQLARIEADGWEKVYFAWAGAVEKGPGKAHYYRVHGPSVLIEYDNIQNNANHIHAVWRDLKNDFGEDLLHKHYATKH